MRETEPAPRVRDFPGWDEFEADVEASILGRNEGTVRFLFAPPHSGNYENDPIEFQRGGRYGREPMQF